MGSGDKLHLGVPVNKMSPGSTVHTEEIPSQKNRQREHFAFFHDLEDTVKSLSAAVLYGSCSVFIALLNKTLMTTLSFNFPIFIMISQMIYTIIILEILLLLKIIQIPRYTLQRGKTFLLPALFYGLNSILALNALGHMNVAMYGVLKRCVPLSTLVFSVFILKKGCPSNPTVISIFLLTLGCFVAAYGDLGFDLKGYASGIFSNFSQAVYLILVQRFSKKNVCTASALQLNSYNTIPLLIILCVIFGEAQNLQTYDNYRSWEFCVIFPLTISMGCLLNYSLFLCTKYTCALTTSVVGGLKAMVQTIFGIFAFGGVSKNISTFLGIAMNLSGGTLYIYTKYKEGLHKKTDSQDGENSNTKEETPQITEVVINGFPANQASSPEGREQVKS
ncbi:hypothetical protein ScPMuIL_004098 [Solemya velum]